jgi:cysteine-rich CPCC protein
VSQRYACLCCGYLTLGEEPPGTYEICPVCWWEDDMVQGKDADYTGGANRVSLREARASFRAFGACERDAVSHVRAPTPEEIPHRR